MPRFGYVILLLWLGLTLLFLDSAPAPQAWVEWTPDYCRRVNCYCEPIRDRLIAQPIAAYSNLAFVIIGLWIVRAAFRTPDLPGPALARRPYALTYGLTLTCTGLFSFFYHASLTRVGDYLDLLGMYLFTGFLMLYNLNRLRPIRPLTFVLAYVGLSAALAISLIVAYSLQQTYFIILILIALLSEGLLQRAGRHLLDRRWLFAALAVFGLGAGVWMLDSNGLLPCWPSFPLWHAAWHITAGTAAGLMFLYYRSERV